ncbi:type IV pilus assembly protein PilW [Methylomagnum ishizawai]|uniref:Type IV pilus assembly protein PilW n=1 Tax=Methylomagnum ishizawai TaxID=1760988 RepID=A0A1Y6CYH4_9GAMM|nr:PilW family protein [Methylomagnum ishizawai]SMF95401.1 type IV pilus assembly protein PilW [Methylomagnum ishizawai]
MFPRYRAALGFSLVEIMVGLVIGSVGIAAVLQLFALSEGQRRSITGGGDAQVVGAAALKVLQSDIRQSGWNVRDINLMGCQLALRAGVALAPLAPVIINSASIPPGDANTDTLLVIYGNGAFQPEGDIINSQPAAANAPPVGAPALAYNPANPDIYAVRSPASFLVGDYVVGMPISRPRPEPCLSILTQVVNVGRGGTSNVIVTAGTGTVGVVNGRLYDLGAVPQMLAYAVRGGNLTVCNYMVNDCGDAAVLGDPAVWRPIGEGVVSLRAQYGRDTRVVLPNPSSDSFDAVVDTYDVSTPPQGVPDPSGNFTATQCGWARIAAVRLALVVRGEELVKPSVSGGHVTSAAPTWAGSDISPINLSTVSAAPGFDWQDYRYKLFQTVIPLRNAAWMGVNNGC